MKPWVWNESTMLDYAPPLPDRSWICTECGDLLRFSIREDNSAHAENCSCGLAWNAYRLEVGHKARFVTVEQADRIRGAIARRITRRISDLKKVRVVEPDG